MFNKDEKIIDVTGIELTPGNHGDNCKGNGTYFDDCNREWKTDDGGSTFYRKN